MPWASGGAGPGLQLPARSCETSVAEASRVPPLAPALTGNYRARAGPAGPLQMEARALPSSAAWAGTVKDPPCKAVSGLTGRTV